MTQKFRHREKAIVEQTEYKIKFSSPVQEEGQDIPEDITVVIPTAEGVLDATENVIVQEAKVTVYFHPNEVKNYMKWKIKESNKINNSGETLFLKYDTYVMEYIDSEDPRVVNDIVYTHDGKYKIPETLPNEQSLQFVINESSHIEYDVVLEETTGTIKINSNVDAPYTIKNLDTNETYNATTNVIKEGIKPGRYRVLFNDIIGYYKPQSLSVTLDLYNLNYETESNYDQQGIMNVRLLNDRISSPFVQWRLVDGYYWHNFGEPVTISTGEKEIKFTIIDQLFKENNIYYRYETPDNITINVVKGGEYNPEVEYIRNEEVEKSKISIIIKPTEIANNVTWSLKKLGQTDLIASGKKSGEIVGDLIGQYQIIFSSLTGYNKPVDINDVVNTNSYDEGSTITLTGTYTVAPVIKNSLEIIPIFEVYDESLLKTSVPPLTIIGEISGPNFYNLMNYGEFNGNPFTELNDGTYQIIPYETIDFKKPGNHVITLENGENYKQTIRWIQK